MIKKALNSKKEIKEFKDKYSNEEIETEVISNLLQPYYRESSPEIENYCNFWYPKNDKDYGLVGILQLMILREAENALKELVGKHDFKYEGNRVYNMYILDFNGLTFTGGAKREVVITKENKKINFKKQLIEFENAYCQMVVDYIFKKTSPNPNIDKYVKEMKELGIIDENNQINFNYQNQKTNKPKI